MYSLAGGMTLVAASNAEESRASVEYVGIPEAGKSRSYPSIPRGNQVPFRRKESKLNGRGRGT